MPLQSTTIPKNVDPHTSPSSPRRLVRWWRLLTSQILKDTAVKDASIWYSSILSTPSQNRSTGEDPNPTGSTLFPQPITDVTLITMSMWSTR